MHTHPLNPPPRRNRPPLPINLQRLQPPQRNPPFIPNNPPKHCIQAIQMRRLIQRHEKLRPIRARSFIRHAHRAPLTVFQARPNLILECFVPDGFSALGIVGRGMSGGAGLDYEVGDEAVEGGVCVVA